MAKEKKVSAPPDIAPKKNGMQGVQAWFGRNWYYFLAFLLPVALIYIAYALFGLYPFGNWSVLCLDLNGQYIYYFEALRDAFHGDGSILYNWSRNLSGGYQGVIGYYLASPFTLIVMLLPRAMILGAMLIMILAKLGCASLTFCYYLRKSKHTSPLLSVMLGTMFGMCAYGIIQTIDPMWLDGLVLLPMIALGVEYLIDDGRKLNYIIPLALMCISNFYIGFMCCIFTVFYYIFYLCYGSDQFKYNLKNILYTTGRMAVATVSAICMAAFMILPVYSALSLGKFDFSTPDWTFKTQFTPLEFIAQFCVNQYNSVNVEGKPEIYCGVLAFLCIPLFFLNRRIPARKKIGYGFLVVVMFLSMIIRPVDMIWHGGQMPNWLPFRYSFIFSFIILSMAAMTLRYVSSIKKPALAGSFVGIMALLIWIDTKKYVNMKGAVYLDTFGSIWLTILLAAAYCGFLILLSKKNLPKKTALLATLGMMAVVGCELTYNAKCEFQDINTEVAYSSRKSYRQYVESGRDLVQAVADYDASLENNITPFYRAEKTYVRTVNDNAGFGLRGLTHSSSVMNTNALKFIEAMGYSCRSYYSRYDGNTPIADSLLGIKYVLKEVKKNSNDNVLVKGNDEYPDQNNSDLDCAYQFVFNNVSKTQHETNLNVGVYQNPNALSLGYMASSDIEKIAFFGNDNPFKSQNILMSTLTGNTKFKSDGNFESWKQYYYEIPLTEELRLNGVRTTPYNTQTNYREDLEQTDLLDADGKHIADPTVDIFFEAQSDDPIYLFFKSENESKVNLWLADQWNEDPRDIQRNVDGSDAISLGSYFENDYYKILYVGTFPKGQKLQLRMTLLTDGNRTKEKYAIIKNFFFAHFDAAAFSEDIKTLQENQWNLTTYGGRTLEGTITAKEGQVMMTSIPYEPGWTVWVDGKKTECIDIAQAMIGVQLTAGEHTVKMRYTPPGLTIGLFLFVIGLAMAVMFYLYDKKYNKTLALIAANKKKGIYELSYEDDPDPEERTFSFIKSKIAKGGNEPDSPSPMTGIMVADEIRKLKELMDEGILTKEEFESQKKKLLGKK